MLPSSTKYRIPELKKKYITADPESINSSLGIAPVLRSHILAFVAERFLNTTDSIGRFMEGSLYGKQFGNREYMKMVISKILTDLERWEFVESMGDIYKATRLGERVSELYVDPLSARMMLDAMKKIETPFDILLMLCNTLEMRPHVRAVKEAEERYSAYIAGGSEVPFYSYNDMNYADYDPVKVFSTAMMLEDWTSEVREAEIVKKYSSTPRRALHQADERGLDNIRRVRACRDNKAAQGQHRKGEGQAKIRDKGGAPRPGQAGADRKGEGQAALQQRNQEGPGDTEEQGEGNFAPRGRGREEGIRANRINNLSDARNTKAFCAEIPDKVKYIYLNARKYYGGGVVEKDRRKQSEEDYLSSALRIDEVRREAQSGISQGLLGAAKGPVVIERIEEKIDYRFQAVFALNPDLGKGPGGLSLVVMTIPRAGEPEAGHEHQESHAELRRLRRMDEDEPEDRSRN